MPTGCLHAPLGSCNFSACTMLADAPRSLASPPAHPPHPFTVMRIQVCAARTHFSGARCPVREARTVSDPSSCFQPTARTRTWAWPMHKNYRKSLSRTVPKRSRASLSRTVPPLLAPSLPFQSLSALRQSLCYTETPPKSGGHPGQNFSILGAVAPCAILLAARALTKSGLVQRCRCTR